MLRFIGLLIAFIFVVPLIRMIVGALGRAFTNFTLGPKARSTQRAAPSAPPRSAVGGALHKDPVCGTYVSESVALRLASSGQTHFFCSEQCRAKFQSQT